MKYQKTHLTESRVCDFCHAEEGKPRLVGQFIVTLGLVEDAGDEKLACQSCTRKIILHKRLNQQQGLQGKPAFFQLKKLWSHIIHTCILVLMMGTVALAQPGLPNAPSQAPIDGGLGLLAAAGGAYALKKLRDRKNNEEENIDL